MPADIEPIPSRKKTAYSCAIFFLFVSAVCQITGLILRWWMTLSLVQLQVSIEVGLFYTTICILDSCQSVSTDKFVKDNIPGNSPLGFSSLIWPANFYHAKSSPPNLRACPSCLRVSPSSF